MFMDRIGEVLYRLVVPDIVQIQRLEMLDRKRRHKRGAGRQNSQPHSSLS